MQLYLLSVRHPEDAASKPPPEVLDRIDQELAAFHEQLRATGAWVFAGGLHPSATAALALGARASAATGLAVEVRAFQGKVD
ncbi:MAG TPA: hypothetical protein VGO78_29405 [Acidimicrobiales bacterium]|nr:hypothetical protein [Acidimicrobiales bacterium]